MNQNQIPAPNQPTATTVLQQLGILIYEKDVQLHHVLARETAMTAELERVRVLARNNKNESDQNWEQAQSFKQKLADLDALLIQKQSEYEQELQKQVRIREEMVKQTESLIKHSQGDMDSNSLAEIRFKCAHDAAMNELKADALYKTGNQADIFKAIEKLGNHNSELQIKCKQQGDEIKVLGSENTNLRIELASIRDDQAIGIAKAEQSDEELPKRKKRKRERKEPTQQ